MGADGSRSDGGVLNESLLGRDIISGTADSWLPDDDFLDELDDIKVSFQTTRRPSTQFPY